MPSLHTCIPIWQVADAVKKDVLFPETWYMLRDERDLWAAWVSSLINCPQL